ncbi:MAG: hypothetical protein M5U14_19520 [Acidimicrobiia bacterium]|nr:hypothetical protein [Acidimicrobiia bacterium]
MASRTDGLIRAYSALAKVHRLGCDRAAEHYPRLGDGTGRVASPSPSGAIVVSATRADSEPEQPEEIVIVAGRRSPRCVGDRRAGASGEAG